jgi:hypothetical protein
LFDSGLLIALTVAPRPDNTEQSPMTEVLTKMDPGALIGLVALAGGLFCALVWIILGNGLEYYRASLAASLKKTMLERGMTAEEIRLVMDAGSKCSQDPCKGPAEVEV